MRIGSRLGKSANGETEKMMTRNEIIVSAFEKEGPHIVVGGCLNLGYGESCYECESCKMEAEFSRQSCEMCNSSLAGSRYALAKIFPGTNQESIYYSVCADCLFFAANGDLPEDE